MQLSTVFFALAAASSAYAADHTVTVGDSNNLVFNPTSLNVQPGDNVLFQFASKNHSVTQSTFASPCSFMTGGINSGFQAVSTTGPPPPPWSITITNTSAPLWFFCAQTNPVNHCNQGMVFAINPTADKSFDAFQAAAKADIVSAPAPGASSAAPSNPSASTGAAGAPGAAPSGAPGAAGAAPSGAPGAAGAAPGASGASPYGAPGAPSGPNPPSSSTAAGAAVVVSGNGGATSLTSGTGTAGAASASTTDNGAARMGASASGILALAGLVAGLML